MKRLASQSKAAVRKDAFDVHRFNQELKVLRTILGGALFVLFMGIGFSIWLIAGGREAIGSPILSAIVSGALSFLAGMGTPREVFWRGGPGSRRDGLERTATSGWR